LRIDIYGIETNEFIVISFKARKRLIDKLDRLVENGVFPSRSEAIREAINMLITKYANTNVNREDKLLGDERLVIKSVQRP